MIPGAVPTRTFRFTDNLEELVRSSSVIGGGTITANNGILTANSPGTDDRALAYLNIYAPRGTVVEITCEARQGSSTSKGRIGIDQYTGDDKIGGGNVDYEEMTDTQWRPYKLTRAGDHKKPFMAITFGVWWAQVGKAEFRNIVVTVYNTQAPSPDVRACLLKCDGGKWSIDDAPGRFTNIGCYGVELTDEYIILRWATFHTWQRPITFAQMDSAGDKFNYNVQVNASEKNFVRLIITKDGARVKPKDVPGSAFIGVQAIGI